jgi:RNA-binding protein
MHLTDKQRRHLRGLAHDLKPVVMVGDSGLTDGVVRETQRALHDHELIKIKVRVGDRDTRDTLIADLATRTTSELVNRIGHVAVLYRRRPDKTGIVLPA